MKPFLYRCLSGLGR